MGFKDYLEIILSLFKDWRVIVTILAMIFVINSVCKIVNYRKQPKKSKVRRIIISKPQNNSAGNPAPEQAPAPEKAKQEEEKEE